MKTRLLLSIVVVLSVFGSVTSAQDHSNKISYQGSLAFNGSTASDGQYSITISLYSSQHATESIWSESYSSDVKNGIFNVLLGSSKSLPSIKAMDRPLWVGISVNGESELRPRTPLTASPLALNVADKAITKAKLDDELMAMILSGKSSQNPQAIMHPFDEIGTGLNTSQTLTIGNSSSLVFTGTGIVDANRFNGNAIIAIANGGTGSASGAWLIGGNTLSSTTAGTEWLGSNSSGSGNKEVWIKTNDQLIMRYVPYTTVPAIIGGASTNTIGTTGSFGSIIGTGTSNSIEDDCKLSVISGGTQNVIFKHGYYDNGDYGFVGGGLGNRATDKAAVVGGNGNQVHAESSFIGAGGGNYIGGGSGEENDFECDNAAIAGGQENSINYDGHHGIIGGGWANRVWGSYSTIGGGSHNEITSTLDLEPDFFDYAAILGGAFNEINGDFATIGGGHDNNSKEGAFIGGGYYNDALGTNSVIGGGYNNTTTNIYATVSGGKDNTAGDRGTTVGGGESNSAEGIDATVAGGIGNDALASYSTVGGGSGNTSGAEYSTIGGGISNDIIIGSTASTIGGGSGNIVSAGMSVISGGLVNTATNSFSTVAGGFDNHATGNSSTVSGGFSNTSFGSGATISGGGSSTANGEFSNIAGGLSNLTNLAAQGVTGYFNNNWGIFPLTMADASDANTPVAPNTVADYNTPLFLVGNGKDVINRHNAFEVSYNGHTTVFDENGNGTMPDGSVIPAVPGPVARPTLKGATYTDNIIYAWGDVSPIPEVMPPAGYPRTVVAHGSEGVSKIEHIALGVYEITLNIQDPSGTVLIPSAVSITANIVLPDPELTEPPTPLNPQCAWIFPSRLDGANPPKFKLRLYYSNCEPVNLPFMFKVTGRP